jgi:hypothetical protein
MALRITYYAYGVFLDGPFELNSVLSPIPTRATVHVKRIVWDDTFATNNTIDLTDLTPVIKSEDIIFKGEKQGNSQDFIINLKEIDPTNPQNFLNELTSQLNLIYTKIATSDYYIFSPTTTKEKDKWNNMVFDLFWWHPLRANPLLPEIPNYVRKEFMKYYFLKITSPPFNFFKIDEYQINKTSLASDEATVNYFSSLLRKINTSYLKTDVNFVNNLEEAAKEVEKSLTNQTRNTDNISSQNPSASPSSQIPTNVANAISTVSSTIAAASNTVDTTKKEAAEKAKETKDKIEKIKSDKKKKLEDLKEKKENLKPNITGKDALNAALAIVLPILKNFINAEKIANRLVNKLINDTKDVLNPLGRVSVQNNIIIFTPRNPGNYTVYKRNFDQKINTLKNSINTLKTILDSIFVILTIVRTGLAAAKVYLIVLKAKNKKNAAIATPELASPSPVKVNTSNYILGKEINEDNIKKTEKKIDNWTTMLTVLSTFVSTARRLLSKLQDKINALNLIIADVPQPILNAPSLSDTLNNTFNRDTSYEATYIGPSSGKEYNIKVIELPNKTLQAIAYDSFSNLKITQTAPSRFRTSSQLIEEVKQILE